MLPDAPQRFPTTHWSLIAAASGRIDADANAALNELCRAYWPPVYCYYRRCGNSADAAMDLTQSFFAQILVRKGFGEADPERGRFRCFLLASARHFLSNERDWARAQKRGGGWAPISLDWQDAERSYLSGLSHQDTPEAVYQKKWAAVVITQAMEELRLEFARAGKAVVFEALRPYLSGEGDAPYAETAVDTGMSEAAVKVTVHRLRRRLAHLLRKQVAKTIRDPGEVDEEIRHLLSVAAL